MKRTCILFIFGTRPEAIKLAPLIKKFRQSYSVHVKICVTAQHRELLDQVLEFFRIVPDYDLEIMKPDQTLFDITANAFKEFEHVLNDCSPDMVIVQGDTTTTFMGALAAFYKKIPVAHIEAGLRSFNKYAPFPEEKNRVLTSHLADLHFAPTKRAKENLLAEGIDEKAVHVVGNTVLDALVWTLEKLKSCSLDLATVNSLQRIDFSKKILLMTGHRRESFGAPFKSICIAFKKVAEKISDLEIVYPVHLNPNVRRPVFKILDSIKNVHLIEPLPYLHFVWLMNKSTVIITDSGGIQEEAPFLGKPVLVLRNTTERPEGVEKRVAKVIGTQTSVITKEVLNLLMNKIPYRRLTKSQRYVYGDGKSSERIVRVIRNFMRIG